MSPAEGTVIGVLRGACDVVSGERLTRLRLSGANAHKELTLAVGDRVTFDFAIPPNTTATVSVPSDDPQSVGERGVPARQAKGVHASRAGSRHAVFEVGSGRYHFETWLPSRRSPAAADR